MKPTSTFLFWVISILTLGSINLVHAQITITLDSFYCVGDTHVTMTMPQHGKFVGPGILGNKFYPNIAGEGVHDISAFHYDVTIEDSLYNPLTGSGTSIQLGWNSMSNALPIGFTFDFYCNSYDSIYASSNGFLTFTPGQPNFGTPPQLPDSSDINNVIAHYWAPQNPSIAGGNINYYTTGSAPNRKFVYNFNDISVSYQVYNKVKQQVILYESSNLVEVHTSYANLSLNLISMTQGVENESGTCARAPRNQVHWWNNIDYARFTPSCDFKQVTVKGALANIPTDVVPCHDDQIGTLTANVIGGTPPFTYSWNDPDSQNTNPAINLSGGIYTLSLKDSSGCVTEIAGTVNSDVELHTNFSIVHNQCEGDKDGILFADTYGGTGNHSYQWSDPDSSTIEDIFDLASGIYFLTVTDSGGCDSVFSATILDIKPRLPLDLGNDTIICLGIPFTLIADSGFKFYKWHNDKISRSFFVTGAGVHAVMAEQWNGCISYDTINVTTIEPGPPVNLANDTAIHPNDANPYVLAAPPNYSSYLWSPGSDTTQSINVFSPGTYKVEAIDNKGCPSSDSITIDIWPVGLEEHEKIAFKLYPNPNNGNFYLTHLVDFDNALVEIYSVDGKKVYSKRIILSTNSTSEFSTSYLSNGVYFIHVSSNESNQHFQMVIR